MKEITVVKEKKMKLEEYFVIRAIKDTLVKKEVVAEKICNQEPTDEEVGFFIFETKATFASVVKNYRLIDTDFLPFD